MMNVRAKCTNSECVAFDKEKSVAVGMLLGYGTSNERVACAICGRLMQTTQMLATSNSRDRARPSGRSAPARRTPKRKKPGRKAYRRKSARE